MDRDQLVREVIAALEIKTDDQPGVYTMRELAEVTGLHLGMVRKTIKKLKNDGVIGTTRVYRINVADMHSLVPAYYLIKEEPNGGQRTETD